MNLRLLLVAGACLLTSTAAYAQFSTPMRDVENPDRTTFRVTCSFTMADSANTTNDGCNASAGTEGKPIILDTINFFCDSPDTSTRFFRATLGTTLLNGSGVAMRFVFDTLTVASTAVNQGITVTGLRLLVNPQNVSSKPGVSFTVSRSPSDEFGSCQAMFIGHMAP